MSECIFYQYKEGDYHCSRTDHDIGDVDFVRKYCWGSCEECPVFNGEQKGDHHRGTDECIYYCMKGGDYYCQKACQYIDSDRVHSYCWGYHYRDCHVYTDSDPETGATASRAEAPKCDTGTHTAASAARGSAYEKQSEPVRTASSTASSGDGDDLSFFSVLLAGIGMALLGIGKLLWKLIRTLPFWGPYALIVLLPVVMLGTMMVAPGVAVAAAVPVLGMLEGCALLLYPILHTVLLVKCKKRQEKGKYRPIYVGFFLFIGSLLILPCIPAVAYQIVWLVREKKELAGGAAQSTAKRDSVERPEPVAAVDGQRAFCPECGHAAAPGEYFCKHCGAKLHEQ